MSGNPYPRALGPQMLSHQLQSDTFPNNYTSLLDRRLRPPPILPKCECEERFNYGAPASFDRAVGSGLRD